MAVDTWGTFLNNLLNVVQVVVLAYIAAKYRNPPKGGGPSKKV